MRYGPTPKHDEPQVVTLSEAINRWGEQWVEYMLRHMASHGGGTDFEVLSGGVLSQYRLIFEMEVY